jgi:universal stress protein E
MNYQRILVGIDFSNASSRALREAVRLASYNATPLLVLHVVDQRVLENLEDEVVVDKNRTLADAKSRLADFIAEHGAGYEGTELQVVLGHPFMEFVRTINDQKIDLLVLGSQGTHDHPNRLGALASKCLRKAATPLLVVDDRQQVPFERVVCAVDYSESSKHVIEEAIHVANLEQAALEFVHVFVPPSSFQSPESGVMLMGFEGIADYPRVAAENLKKYVEPYVSQFKGRNVTFNVVDHVSVGRGVVDYLKENGGDLLVLGTHGRTGWRSLLLGTTAEHIFHRIPCSTLAVKPTDFTYSIPTL